jgi:hypothetical protein
VGQGSPRARRARARARRSAGGGEPRVDARASLFPTGKSLVSQCQIRTSRSNAPSRLTCCGAAPVRSFLHHRVLQRDLTSLFHLLFAAPANQFNEVYRYGTFDGCGKSLTEFRTCLYAKFVVSREPERAHAMLDAAKQANRRGTDEKTPWEIKKTPGWGDF